MSLEAAITELTKNVVALIEVTRASDELRKELLDKAVADAKRTAGAEKPKGAARQITESPEDRKPVEAAVEKPAPAPAAEKKVEKPAEKKPADVSADSPAATAVSAFVGAAADAEDRNARVASVREILTKLGVERTSEVTEADVPRFLKAIEKRVEQFAAKPAAEEDDL